MASNLRSGVGNEASGAAAGYSVPLPLKRLARFTQAGRVTCVDAVHGSTFFAIGSDSGIMHIWESEHLKQGKMPLARFGDRGSALVQVTFAIPPRQIIAASQDGTIRVWSIAKQSNLVTRHLPDPCTILAICQEQQQVAAVVTGTFDISVYDVLTMSVNALLRGHTDVPQTASFVPQGSWLVSGGADGTLRIWDLVTEASLAVFTTLEASAICMLLTELWPLIVVGDVDGKVHVLNCQGGRAADHSHRSRVLSKVAHQSTASEAVDPECAC